MIFKSIFRRNKKRIKDKIEQKFDMNSWMNLTKEERFAIDFEDKNELMKKKKALLKSIREEYIKIKKKE
tara:strand:- start:648 stop:854 length:207 start_codon:yes stop_codon:yes gene_type:complete